MVVLMNAGWEIPAHGAAQDYLERTADERKAFDDYMARRVRDLTVKSLQRAVVLGFVVLITLAAACS